MLQQPETKPLSLLRLLAIGSATLLPQAGLAVELTALIGYSGGGQFEDSHGGGPLTAQASESTAFIAALDTGLDQQYELLYSYQNTRLKSDAGLSSVPEFDLRFHYLHLGGNYFFNGRTGLAPYVAGGIGLTLIDPRIAGADRQLRPSMNLAFGLSWAMSDRLGLRAELRGYGTLMDNASSITCNGGCNIRVTGDLLHQYQFNSGLSWRF